ncbi:MAG: PAS domain S-box protein [bacterium]
MSIRRKLFIILLLLSTIPVTIVGLIAVNDSQKSLEKQIGASSLEFARLSLQPVLAVAAMARAIGKGDYKKRVSVKSNDEVGLLSASFNKMVKDLQESKDAILLEKQRLDDVTRFANCGFLLTDEQVRITYANQVAQEWFGSFEQIKGKFCREIFGPEYPVKECTRCVGLEVLRTGQTVHSDIFPKAVNGEDKFFYVIASPVKDNDGNICQIIEVIIDMTEHKHAEEELRKFKTISDKASYGTAIADLNGKLVYVNDTFAEMHGYKRKELIGKHLSIFHSEEQMEGVNPLLDVLKRTGRFVAEEVWHKKKDGSVFPTLMNASIITDDNGEPLLMSATAIDITELKRTEDQLRTLSRAIDQSPTSVIITDPQGNIEYVNPKFSQITGYTAKEVLGKNPRILKSGETPAKEYKKLWDTITSGGEWRGEFHNKKKNGELFWESASVSPIRDSEGVITHFVAVKEDITERKRLQEQRAELEKELRHAQKMETVGTLAGGIAHDFNNILQAIQGYVEMCLDDASDTRQVRADLEEVLEATGRAKSLVRQILTFSRHAEQERKPLRLNPIVKEALKLLKASLPSTIEIRHNLDAGCSAVLADPTQIHQVLMNLCTNAYQAMDRDGGVLEVNLGMVVVDAELSRTYPNLSAGQYVRLTVRDTGRGMSQSTRERIFEPFFTTKVGEGTGLGLSVVHGIVANHDGEITVESKPGKGTTFHVYLPQLESGMEQESQRAETLLRGKERILFVDDEEVVAAVVKRLLDRLGYDVTLRNSSVAALETFRAQPDKFDLVMWYL